MENYNRDAKPFMRFIFVSGTILLLSSMIIISGTVYYSDAKSNMRHNQQQLAKIAENAAMHVSADNHEKIITNDQDESSEYKEIQTYFQEVMHGNPLIDDIYTLRPTEDKNKMTFVVAGMETFDANNDNFLDDSEVKPFIGEEYDITGLDDLKSGLIAPAYDKSVTSDKWGQWLSGYAPIKNSDGDVVAVLGVDYAASEITDRNNDTLRTLIYLNVILAPILLLFIFLIARTVSIPFKALAEGLDRVSHGEFDYRLPLVGKRNQRIFVSLFNSMNAMYETSCREKHKNCKDCDHREPQK